MLRGKAALTGPECATKLKQAPKTRRPEEMVKTQSCAH